MELKPRKNQKCTACKKIIKKEWAYNGKWWCQKCKDKDSKKRIREYLKSLEK